MWFIIPILKSWPLGENMLIGATKNLWNFETIVDIFYLTFQNYVNHSSCAPLKNTFELVVQWCNIVWLFKHYCVYIHNHWWWFTCVCMQCMFKILQTTIIDKICCISNMDYMKQILVNNLLHLQLLSLINIRMKIEQQNYRFMHVQIQPSRLLNNPLF